jgi:hypothetical protein
MKNVSKQEVGLIVSLISSRWLRKPDSMGQQARPDRNAKACSIYVTDGTLRRADGSFEMLACVGSAINLTSFCVWNKLKAHWSFQTPLCLSLL